MLDNEASLGEKLMLIECMPAAAAQLSNNEGVTASPLQDRFEAQQKSDNSFFGIQSIFDNPIKQIGKVTKVSKSLG